MTTLRIVGDGTVAGTKVETESGEEIRGVISVKLILDAESHMPAEVTITLRRFLLDLKRTQAAEITSDFVRLHDLTIVDADSPGVSAYRVTMANLDAKLMPLVDDKARP